MKIVINICFGGFGLSTEAMLRLIELGSPIIKKTEVKEYYGGNLPGWGHNWEARYLKDLEDCQDAGNGFRVKRLLGTLYKDGYAYSYSYSNRAEEFRSDPFLVQVVEELGEGANGYCASLKIVEIPDDIEYEISEYDGSEHIAEIHRTWR